MALTRLEEQAQALRNSRADSLTRGEAEELMPLVALEPLGLLILSELFYVCRRLGLAVHELYASRQGSESAVWTVLDKLQLEGKHDEVVWLCGQLPSEAHVHPEVLYCHAVSLHRIGKPRTALRLLGVLLANEPEDEYAHYAAGNACRSLGWLRGAYRHYRSAVSAQGGVYFESLNNLGLTLNDLGRPKAAARYLLRALDLEPDDGGVMNNLGDSYAAMGQLELAEDFFRAVLAMYPENVDGAEGLSRLRLARALA